MASKGLRPSVWGLQETESFITQEGERCHRCALAEPEVTAARGETLSQTTEHSGAQA